MTRWLPVLVLVLAAALGTAAAEEGNLPTDLRPVVADGQRVAEVLDEAGVDRTPADPAMTDWIAAVSRRATAWFAERMVGHGTLLDTFFTGAGWLMVVLVVLLAIAGIVVCVIALRQRRMPGVDSSDGWSHPDAMSSEPGALSAEQAWMEFEHLLDEGRTREATEPLWHWLVAVAAGDRGEASWTSGDLVRHTRRFEDLGPVLARLDAVVYGALKTEPEQLRRLADDLRGLV
jgi:hypothetical protein